MASSPLDGDLGEALVGVLLGIGAAFGTQYVFVWRNLRWSWALLPAGTGVLVGAGARIVESWSVAIAVGGVLTARWVFLLERRDREAGGDARRRAREAIGISDVLAARRGRRTPARR
jgi:hypothetical protein